jgi:two-component system sensor histidine kinase PilS (NtrC family)
MLVGRLAIIGGLSVLGIAVMGSRAVSLAYGLVGATAVASTAAVLASSRSTRIWKRTPAGLAVLDSLLLGVIVHFGGGLDGPLAVFFFVHALYAGYMLGARGGLYLALIDIAVLSASGILNVNGLNPAEGSKMVRYLAAAPQELTYRYIVLRLTLHACLLITAGLVSGYLSDTLRRESGRLREALDALLESNARSRDILESLVDGVLAMGADGEPLSANSAARRMLGLGERWQDDLAASPVRRLMTHHADSGGAGGNIDLVLGDRILECRTGGFDRGPSREPGVLLVMTDVTELRHLRSRLEERDKLAVIGRLSATMAHEIRNPLASISGAAQVIRSSGQEGGHLDRMVDLIVGQTRRASDIIEGYLELARGSRNQDEAEVRLDLLVDEAVDTARRSYATGTALKVRSLSEAVVRGRESRLSQLAGNLIRNSVEAVEHTEGGTVEVEVAVDTAGGSAVLRVCDNGPGMPADMLPRATEPFLTTREYGTGLGLYVVRRVAEEHNGSVSFRNIETGGLEVTVSIPLAGSIREAGA